MNYQLLHDTIQLLETFENTNHYKNHYSDDIQGFKAWINDNQPKEYDTTTVNWEGKMNGRSADSIINTLIVHINRYARSYSKAAIVEGPFSTQDEFVYLIILRAHASMTKMELIKKNIQEKSVGMQTINKLIKQEWISQTDSDADKRSKLISITPLGIACIETEMLHIRKATSIVTGNLSQNEKLELIKLLQKLDTFHNPIYNRNLPTNLLLDQAYEEYNSKK